MNVELPIWGHVRYEENEDQDDRVGVGDQEPVRNVFGEELDKRIRRPSVGFLGHLRDSWKDGGSCIAIAIQGN